LTLNRHGRRDQSLVNRTPLRSRPRMLLRLNRRAGRSGGEQQQRDHSPHLAEGFSRSCRRRRRRRIVLRPKSNPPANHHQSWATHRDLPHLHQLHRSLRRWLLPGRRLPVMPPRAGSSNRHLQHPSTLSHRSRLQHPPRLPYRDSSAGLAAARRQSQLSDPPMPTTTISSSPPMISISCQKSLRSPRRTIRTSAIC